MRRYWIIALLFAGIFLSACSGNQADTAATPVDPALENVIPPDVALNVQNFISQQMGIAVESVEIKSVEQKDWPDACLGLPNADEACAEAVTPGWLLTFDIDNQEYRYRVDQTGTVIRQEP